MESVSPTLLLVLAVASLYIGPVLSAVAKTKTSLETFFDGLALTLVGGLVVFHAIPHVIEHDLMLGSAALLIGATAPWLGQRWAAVHSPSLLLLLFALHAILDGSALTLTETDMVAPLGWAIIAHRLPVSLALVKAAQKLRAGAGGLRLAWFATTVLGVATLIGFYGGSGMTANLPEWAIVGLEGLVVGMLLHVVVAPHQSTLLDQTKAKAGYGAGALTGVLLVVWFTQFAGV
jgi:hypothetical protein